MVASLLLVAGCKSGEDPTIDTGPGTSSSSSAPTTGPSSSTSTVPLVTPPVSVPGPAERAYLTAVRVAAAADGGGGSRVVFEFDPVVPGYAIDYIDRPVTEDASGAEVQVEGEAILQVRMTNAATARIDGEKVVRTYTGPKRVPAAVAASVAVEAVDTGDFEGQVTWVVGLRAKPAAISVTTLTGPPRLVLDFPSPAAAST